MCCILRAASGEAGRRTNRAARSAHLNEDLSECTGEDDVPGFEIPARYFQFVRSGDARLLSGVLEHNRRDLVSLALITVRLLHLIDAGPDATMDSGKRWPWVTCTRTRGWIRAPGRPIGER